jgi:hypothetical protein
MTVVIRGRDGARVAKPDLRPVTGGEIIARASIGGPVRTTVPSQDLLADSIFPCRSSWPFGRDGRWPRAGEALSSRSRSRARGDRCYFSASSRIRSLECT